MNLTLTLVSNTNRVQVNYFMLICALQRWGGDEPRGQHQQHISSSEVRGRPPVHKVGFNELLNLDDSTHKESFKVCGGGGYFVSSIPFLSTSGTPSLLVLRSTQTTTGTNPAAVVQCLTLLITWVSLNRYLNKTRPAILCPSYTYGRSTL